MKNIKLVSIDVDGCLVAYTNIGSLFQSSWDALGYSFGLKEEWDKRTKKYYPLPEMDKQWAEMDTADLIGRPVKKAEEFLYPIPYSKGAEEFCRFSKGKIIRGILSTCIDLVGYKAAEELSLEFVHCNILHRNNGNFAGTIDYLVPLAKQIALPKIENKFNIPLEEICHVGDNENDLGVAEKVGLFVAFNPKKEKVAQKAKYVINDFRELSKILGIR